MYSIVLVESTVMYKKIFYYKLQMSNKVTYVLDTFGRRIIYKFVPDDKNIT